MPSFFQKQWKLFCVKEACTKKWSESKWRIGKTHVSCSLLSRVSITDQLYDIGIKINICRSCTAFVWNRWCYGQSYVRVVCNHSQFFYPLQNSYSSWLDHKVWEFIHFNGTVKYAKGAHYRKQLWNWYVDIFKRNSQGVKF